MVSWTWCSVDQDVYIFVQLTRYFGLVADLNSSKMRLTLTNTNLSAIDRLSISLKVDEAEIDEFKRNHCLDYSDEKA